MTFHGTRDTIYVKQTSFRMKNIFIMENTYFQNIKISKNSEIHKIFSLFECICDVLNVVLITRYPWRHRILIFKTKLGVGLYHWWMDQFCVWIVIESSRTVRSVPFLAWSVISRRHILQTTANPLFGPAKSCCIWGFREIMIIFPDIFGSGLIQILDDGFLWSGGVTVWNQGAGNSQMELNNPNPGSPPEIPRNHISASRH